MSGRKSLVAGSPDGAQRNPGAAVPRGPAAPHSAALRAGYSLQPGILTQVRETLTREHRGTPRRLLTAQVEAPSFAPDRTAYELWVARRAFELLDAAYPGHLWLVDCDLGRGGVSISIPVLMGGNWVYFIRMPDLEPRRVLIAGGELLERYGIARGKLRVDQFVAARDRHSILVDRSNKVPG